MSRKTTAAELEIRRKKVAANLLGGLNYRQMSEALGVSLGTIARDVKIIMKRWQAEQVKTLTEVKTLELQRIDRAINAIWPKVNDGSTNAIGTMIKLMERRAKLLGLDALDSEIKEQMQQRSTNREVEELSDEALLQIATGSNR